MTILEIIFVVFTFILLAHSINKSEECDDRQEKLDKREIALDERANKLALWEDELKTWSRASEGHKFNAYVSKSYSGRKELMFSKKRDILARFKDGQKVTITIIPTEWTEDICKPSPGGTS